ncbi:hypothetical protein OTB20_23820, partial [Streptomyces sp. H27-H1]|uniref:hypothetical protein n=1 Tax=Streptomyces sp. H27-H1 TaxID=2996461 RepID=UPI00226D6C69
VSHATIRIGFADQMISSFNASSEPAALIEHFVIPSPGSASPISSYSAGSTKRRPPHGRSGERGQARDPA